jgi:hypothetical protein
MRRKQNHDSSNTLNEVDLKNGYVGLFQNSKFFIWNKKVGFGVSIEIWWRLSAFKVKLMGTSKERCVLGCWIGDAGIASKKKDNDFDNFVVNNFADRMLLLLELLFMFRSFILTESKCFFSWSEIFTVYIFYIIYLFFHVYPYFVLLMHYFILFFWQTLFFFLCWL